MCEYPVELHLPGHPAPTAASNSTKTTSAQTPRPPPSCRGSISGQKPCNPQLHTSCDQSSPATATSQQNGSPHYLLTVPLGTKSPRNSSAPQSTGILCAEFPSFPEFSKSRAAAGPTKFHEPTPPPHPHHRSGSRRSGGTASPASIHRATFPAEPQREDLAMAPTRSRAAPESAPASARSGCRICTPHQRTTTLARAAPFRPCTHSPAKSCFLFFLTSFAASLLPAFDSSLRISVYSVSLRYLFFRAETLILNFQL